MQPAGTAASLSPWEPGFLAMLTYGALVFALMLSIYPITRFLIEWLRSDEAAVRGTAFSIGQCVSLAVLAFAVVFWQCILRRPKGTAFSKTAAAGAGGGASQKNVASRK